MLTSYTKAPFPYFGGKRQAAPLVWRLLGDPVHYIEPFAGSLAVLLERPHPCNRPYYSETINDADGLVINAWRAMQWQPEATAEACSWPVSEVCKQARQAALLEWAGSGMLDLLAGSPEWCDPQMAGWWLYAMCCQIGAFHGVGPWTADPVSGRLVKRGTGELGVFRDRPHPGSSPGQALSNNGLGVNHAGLREPGITRQRTHLSDNGQGVHRPQLREPGVTRNLPHLTTNGRGVHHAGLREPGVSRDLPHLSDGGRGVHHAGLREPGVSRDRPHLSDNGRGVHRPQLREPGVWRNRPHPGSSPGQALSDNGQACTGASSSGVNHAGLREPGVGEACTGALSSEPEFHPLVMPELRRWFRWLSARLRHVRIVNGDWSRVCTTGAMYTLNVRQGEGVCGVFLDPPYSPKERSDILYQQDGDVTAAVRAWCVEAGQEKRTRIVLAGYDTEHAALEAHGWTVHTWYTEGFLRGGYGNIDGSSQQHRERLWASPHCVLQEGRQLGLFG